MTRTQAIVFDMDGVLIDSEELHAHAKRIAFAHAGIALSDADLQLLCRPERCRYDRRDRSSIRTD